MTDLLQSPPERGRPPGALASQGGRCHEQAQPGPAETVGAKGAGPPEESCVASFASGDAHHRGCGSRCSGALRARSEIDQLRGGHVRVKQHGGHAVHTVRRETTTSGQCVLLRPQWSFQPAAAGRERNSAGLHWSDSPSSSHPGSGTPHEHHRPPSSCTARRCREVPGCREAAGCRDADGTAVVASGRQTTRATPLKMTRTPKIGTAGKQ